MSTKFAFKKLVRDKIPVQQIANGDKPEYWKLNDADYVKELIRKLNEEVSEFGRESNLEEEIADVEEILDCLINVTKSSRNKINSIREKKNTKAGSFKKRLYIDYVKVNSNSPWLQYFLKNPDKYPEIK